MELVGEKKLGSKREKGKRRRLKSKVMDSDKDRRTGDTSGTEAAKHSG